MLPVSDLNKFERRAEAASQISVKYDPTAGTFTPNAVDLHNGTMINISNTDHTTNLTIAQSSSLATPCIEIASQTFIKGGEGWSGQGDICTGPATRSMFSILYIGQEPLIIYGVGACQRGAVFSVNLPPADVLTLTANAKSAPREETPDLSHLTSARAPSCSFSSSGPVHRLSPGAIAGVVVGSIAVLVSILAIFLVVQRKRRQRKSEAAAKSTPFSKNVD